MGCEGWERREERLEQRGNVRETAPPVERYVDAKSPHHPSITSIDVHVAFMRLLGTGRDCAPTSFVQHHAFDGLVCTRTRDGENVQDGERRSTFVFCTVHVI
jgi:hypothetical protein